MGESLDRNCFYRALVTTYEKWFRLAGEKCYVICVPQNSTVVGTVDEVMICSHILKPSPLLKMNYVPLNTSRVTNVERTEREFISTARNRNKTKSSIIEIEEAYNSKNQNYEIILIDTPFIESASNHRSQLSTSDFRAIPQPSQQEILTDHRSCCDYLRNLSSSTSERVERKVHHLLSSYIILPDYLDDAAQRINAINSWAQEVFYAAAGDHLNPEVLESAIECFVMGIAHEKVYAAVVKRYERDEREFAYKLKNIGAKCPNLESLGCDPIYKNFVITDEMKRLLRELETYKTGLEKVVVMKNILNEINDGLSRAISSNATPFGGLTKAASILPDDLVAAVIHLLLKAEPNRLLTNIRYIETFNWHLPTKNEFGYSLVTFQVALEYVNNSSLALENANRKSSDGSRSRGYSFIDYCKQTSQLDTDLEKITKLIESKTSISDNSTNRNGDDAGDIEEVKSSGKDENDLGEFLTTLQRNKFAVNFGKQT